MAENTLIDYATASWSPVVGCTKCSPGCDHCFAIRQVWRMAHNPNPKIRAANEWLVTTRGASGRAVYQWTGEVRCLPDRLDWPLRWRKPKRILTPTLGDLFHEDVPLDFLVGVFETMARSAQHRFLMLTKRPERMSDVWNYIGAEGWPHIFPGVTVCNQDEADAKLPVLLSIPAAGHWVSIEPILGPVRLGVRFETGTDYGSLPPLRFVVAGAETGLGARPAHPDWLRSLRDQCKAAGVPFFFKGWGEWLPSQLLPGTLPQLKDRQMGWVKPDGTWWGSLDASRKGTAQMYRVGRKLAGHLLDGVAHREIPDALKVAAE